MKTYRPTRVQASLYTAQGDCNFGCELDEIEDHNWIIVKLTNREFISAMGCCDNGAFRFLATKVFMKGSKNGFSHASGLVNPVLTFFLNGFWKSTPLH